MKHHFIDPKEEIALPNDVTLALSTGGDIVAIDAHGTRRALDNDDHVRWFWYSAIGKFPERPRIPHDPAAQERARQAQPQSTPANNTGSRPRRLSTAAWS